MSNNIIDAAISGDIEQLQSQISAGADINQKDKNGRTALMHAAYKGRVAIVQFLLENNAALHIEDVDGDTALVYAEICKNPEIVKLLEKATLTTEAEKSPVNVSTSSITTDNKSSNDLYTSKANSKSLSPKALIVSQREPQYYQSINQAIIDAALDATILVRPGIYTESVILEKNIRLIGDGALSDIQIRADNSHCIEMQADCAEVNNLTIYGRANYNAAYISKGKLTINNCDLMAENGSVIYVKGLHTTLNIHHSSIHDSKKSGINIAEDGQIFLEDCEIHGNLEHGINVENSHYDEVSWYWENSTLSNYYAKDRLNFNICDCKIFNNRRNGISCEIGNSLIEECNIFSNSGSNIRVNNFHSVTKICKSKIYEGDNIGISIYSQTGTTIENCDIYANSSHNIHFKSSKNFLVQNSQINDGLKKGILAYESQGSIINCEINNNQQAGIETIRDNSLTIRDCLIRDSKDIGIWIKGKGQTIIENCRFSSISKEPLIVENQDSVQLVNNLFDCNQRYTEINNNGNTTNDDDRADETYSRLLKERIVFIGREITEELSNLIISLLLTLEAEDSTKDIYLYINSPGGYAYPAKNIYDTMQNIKPDICTVCVGLAAQTATLLLSAGTKGKRLALPASRIMINSLSAEYLNENRNNEPVDIEEEAKETLAMRKLFNQLLAEYTGQPVDKIIDDTHRDYFMSAFEAEEYGIIDKVVDKHNQPSASNPLF